MATKAELEKELAELKASKSAPQEVIITNEKPSVGSRIKEYGLFAVTWHVVGAAVNKVIEEI